MTALLLVAIGEWDRLARFAAIAQRVALHDLDARMLDVRLETER